MSMDMKEKVTEVNAYDVTRESLSTTLKYLKKFEYTKEDRLENYTNIHLMLGTLVRFLTEFQSNWDNPELVVELSDKYMKDLHVFLKDSISTFIGVLFSQVEEKKKQFESMKMLRIEHTAEKSKGQTPYA